MTRNAHPVVAVIQTRMTSTRLPGKVLMPLAAEPMIRRVIERVRRIEGIDRIALALAEGNEHDPIADAVADLDVLVTRGSETDVLARTARTARAMQAGTVMRVTSDCPFIDPAVSGVVLAAFRAAGNEIAYARTAFDRGFPLGLDTEVFAARCLYEAEAEAEDPYEREHVTPFIWRRPERFPSIVIGAEPDRRHWRLVVDTPEDYELATRIYDALHEPSPQFGLAEIAALFEQDPSLQSINAGIAQKPYINLHRQQN